MQTAFKIEGVVIKRPSTFKISRYNITTLTRIASGKMCGDLVAKKRTFTLNYAAITSAELKQIFDIIWETKKLFLDFEYVEDNVVKTAKVYTSALPIELGRTGHLWVWKNFNFELIEQ